MARVILDMSISLDGFIPASDPRMDEPLGDSGPVLHEWIMG